MSLKYEPSCRDGTSNGDSVKGYGEWNVDDQNGYGHWSPRSPQPGTCTQNNYFAEM